MRILFFISLFIVHFTLSGQDKKSEDNPVIPDGIEFRDTLNGFVTDSFASNLGKVPHVEMKLKKYFKYIGPDTIFITRSWTNDPHYICEYPQGVLEQGKIYSFTICLTFIKARGRFEKTMGFYLNNKRIIPFVFKGEIIPDE